MNPRKEILVWHTNADGTHEWAYRRHSHIVPTPRKETPLSIEEIKRIARAPVIISHSGGCSWGGAMPLPDDTTPRNEYDAWRALRSQHQLPRRNDEERD